MWIRLAEISGQICRTLYPVKHQVPTNFLVSNPIIRGRIKFAQVLVVTDASLERSIGSRGSSRQVKFVLDGVGVNVRQVAAPDTWKFNASHARIA